jgi:putative ABC transport system substrate-binding protein
MAGGPRVERLVHMCIDFLRPGLSRPRRFQNPRILRDLKARSPAEIEAAFAALGQLHANALVVGDDAFFYDQRDQIAALEAQYSLLANYSLRGHVVAGGFSSYGTSVVGLYRQSAGYVARVLKGAKPGDLPVEQPTKFEFVINLKTAKALGLTVPPALLARADEVIE